MDLHSHGITIIILLGSCKVKLLHVHVHCSQSIFETFSLSKVYAAFTCVG